MKKFRAEIRPFLALLLAAACLTSALFPFLELHHDCCGEDCPVCLQIAFVRDLGKILALGCLLTGLSMQEDADLSLRPLPAVRRLMAQTPVTLKVKFSN